MDFSFSIFCKVVYFLEFSMKTKYMLLLVFCGLVLQGPQMSFKIKSKFSHLKLIDDWVFLSMETITYNEEEREVVLQDEKMWRHFLFIGRDRCHLFS